MSGPTLSVPVSRCPRKSLSVVEVAPIRAPTGAVIGQIVFTGGERVFLRTISAIARPRVLFRELDGWPLGAHVLREVRRWGATRLRYRTPEGTYEIPLASFCAGAIPLDFPHERQHVLPRAQWAFTPAHTTAAGAPRTRVEQQGLFSGLVP